MNPTEIAQLIEEEDIWADRPQPDFTAEKAREIGNKLGIDWDKYDIEQFRMGLGVEMEHGTIDPQTDVTGDDLIKTGKIALMHIKEIPDYYTRLERMESEVKS